MTPQTAAALRALEQKWRQLVNVVGGMGAGVYMRCADELAAVLTQEGAECGVWMPCEPTKEILAAMTDGWSCGGDPRWEYHNRYRQMLDVAAKAPRKCAELRNELDRYMSNTDAMRAPVNKMCETAKLIAAAGRVVKPINERAVQETLPPVGMKFDAPAEPRAAEGAGTSLQQAMHEVEQHYCDPVVGDAIKLLKAKLATAAAAVPAGGDAVQVTGGLKTDADRADALDSLATALESDFCTMGDRIQAAGWLQTFAYQLRNAPAPRGGVTEAHIDTMRNGSLVFRNAAREYLAAVAHLFDSKAGKDGKFLAEMSPLHDQQCLDAFKNLNDTGARLKQCCDKLDGIVAEPPAADAVR